MQNENLSNPYLFQYKMLKRPPAPLNLTCGVCSAPAPDHLHFGGESGFLRSILHFCFSAHTCYSCRAFFRRTAQRKAAKGLKRCRTGLKNCEVSDQKKNCIHCRYLKCINIGMTTDLMQVKISILFRINCYIYIVRDNGKKLVTKCV